jgi:hypothetical protein
MAVRSRIRGGHCIVRQIVNVAGCLIWMGSWYNFERGHNYSFNSGRGLRGKFG